MSRTVKTNILLFIFTGLLAVGIFNCSDDSTTNNTTPNTPAAGTMSGTITFFDTNRVYSNGYYNVSVYTSWPPTGAPSGGAIINLTKTGNEYKGTYSITGLTSGGSYVTVAAWIKEPYAPGSVYVLGVRGCDTSVSCAFVPPTGVKWDTLPSNQGLANLDFKAALDTAKKMYNF